MKNIIYLIIAVVLLSACNKDRFTYIRNNEIKNYTEDTIFQYIRKNVTYTLQPHDRLSIQIITLNEQVNSHFNNDINTNNSGGRFIQYSGYELTDSGTVTLPIIGTIRIGGLTVLEAKTLLENEASKNFEYARVNMYLLNYNIYFLGEINAPGLITVNSDKINLLQALTLCGGLTEYAKRKELLIMRTTMDGYITYRVDVTDRKILESKDFFLMPNDIIIAEPVKYKLWRSYFNDYQFYFSVITASITTITLIKSLK